MGALALFGVPPEEYWPYDTTKFDREPPTFCYAFAQSYQAIKFYRLEDPPNTPKDSLLNRIKTNLAAGLPSMPSVFGFTVYSSPCPGRYDWTVVAVEGDESALKISRTARPPDPDAVPPPPGRGTDQLFEIRAKSPGCAVVRLEQRRPFAPEESPIDERVLDATVGVS